MKCSHQYWSSLTTLVQFDQHNNVLINWADFRMYRNPLSICDYWIKGYLHWVTRICCLNLFGGFVPFFELMGLFNMVQVLLRLQTKKQKKQWCQLYWRASLLMPCGIVLLVFKMFCSLLWHLEHSFPTFTWIMQFWWGEWLEMCGEFCRLCLGFGPNRWNEKFHNW